MNTYEILGSILLQTTLVLTVASIAAMLILRISGCRRPWVHQCAWGGVLLLGLFGMRIPVEVVDNRAGSVSDRHGAGSVSDRHGAGNVSDRHGAESVSDRHGAGSVSDRHGAESVSDRLTPQPITTVEPLDGENQNLTTATTPQPIVVTTVAPPDSNGRLRFPLRDCLLFAWTLVFLGAIVVFFVRYLRMLVLLRNAASPDEQTQTLWLELCSRQGLAQRKIPRIRMLPDGGPAMVRTPLGYTLVLSQSHWNELGPELRRGIMRHELAHFLYGDLWKTLFARMIVLVHWFNPLAHFAAKRFEEAAEWSADSFSYGMEEKGLEHFAEAMITLHETTPQNYRYRVAFGTKNILRRLEFLKRLKTDSKESLMKTSFVLVFTLLVLALGAINIRIVAQTNPGQETKAAVSQSRSSALTEEPVDGKNQKLPTTHHPLPTLLTILDTEGNPIVGATGHVGRVDKDNKRPYQDYTTDANGQVKLERTTPDNAQWFSFNVKTAGYVPFYGVWEADREPRFPPDEFTVKLEKAKTIGGIVLDPEGKPVNGVNVEFSFPYGKNSFNDDSTGCGASGQTDEHGRWSCGYVPFDVLGSLRFSLHHPDFKSTRIEVDVDDLKPDAEGKFLHVFTIQRGYEIHGTVRDENGNAIPDARVEVQFFGVTGTSKDWYRRTQSDSQGKYRFTNCPLTDSAAVVAQHPGFAGKYAETPVGSTPKEVNVQLEPSKPLKLRFVDENGNAIKKLYVFVSKWGSMAHLSTPISRMLRKDNFEPMDFLDENGNWVWNDAIAGKFQISAGAEGFMSQNDVDVEAGNEIQTIVLKPQLHVTATVVDDETGDLIPNFRYIEGLGNTAPGNVSWQRAGKPGKDGAFEYTTTRPERYDRRLRVEADGYAPCDSRFIRNEEGTISLEFRLVKSPTETPNIEFEEKPRSGVVLCPDGKPANQATIIVSRGIYLQLNRLGHHTQTQTDKDGKFTLPKWEITKQDDQSAKFALVLIHDNGCAYLRGEDFDKTHNTAQGNSATEIILQPWGELEGTLKIASEPGEGTQLEARRRFDVFDENDLRFEFVSNVTTGPGGRFSLRKLFPGNYFVNRDVVVERSGGMTRMTRAIGKFASVESGKVTKINIGDTGRPVIGRVELTPEQLSKGRPTVSIRAPSPEFPEFPQMLAADRERLLSEKDPEKAKEHFAIWLLTEAGQQHQSEIAAYNEEVRKRIREDRSSTFGGVIKPDGTFRIENVESGHWIFGVTVYNENTRELDHSQPLEIPEMPGGRSDEPLDLGTIQIKPQPRPQPQPPIPHSPSVTLLVVDAKEKPIPGAEVVLDVYPGVTVNVLTGKQLTSPNRRLRFETDQLGRLTLSLPDELPKSFSYHLNIDGYAPAWLAWEGIKTRADLPKEYTLKLDDAQSVGGILVDEDGKPIAGAVIDPKVRPIQRAEDTRTVAGGRECTTDEHGRWVFRSIPASYTSLGLEIMHPDFMAFRPNIPTASYSLKAGAEPEKPLVLQRGRRATGIITDLQGEPIPGAIVRTKFLNDNRQAIADENGFYNLPGIPVGEMTYIVSAKGKSPQLKKRDVKPESPQELRDDIQLAPGRTIRVRINDEQGQPVPDVYVFLREWNDTYVNWIGNYKFYGLDPDNRTTNEDGLWEWNEAPEEEIVVTFSREGMQQIGDTTLRAREKEYVFVATPPGSAGVSPANGGRDARTPRVSSTVFLPGETQATASRARVYLLDENSQGNIMLGKMELELSGTGTESDENGRFALPEWEKPFWIWVLHEKGFAHVLPGEFKPETGIKLTSWSRVEGTVFKGLKPAAGEKVFLPSFGKPKKYDTWGEDIPNFYMRYKTVSDENGKFSFDYVVPGSGTAARVLECVSAQQTGLGGGSYAYMEPFQVKPGETATVQIGGRGRPVIGKFAQKIPETEFSQIILLTEYDSPFVFGAAIEPDGSFRIEDAPPGKHKFSSSSLTRN